MFSPSTFAEIITEQIGKGFGFETVTGVSISHSPSCNWRFPVTWTQRHCHQMLLRLAMTKGKSAMPPKLASAMVVGSEAGTVKGGSAMETAVPIVVQAG